MDFGLKLSQILSYRFVREIFKEYIEYANSNNEPSDQDTVKGVKFESVSLAMRSPYVIWLIILFIGSHVHTGLDNTKLCETKYEINRHLYYI